MQATIVKKSEKEFSLMLGEHEIGVSKTDFDARFHMHAINDALQVSFLEGQKYLERIVEKQRLDREINLLIMEAKLEQERQRAELTKKIIEDWMRTDD